VEDAIDDADLKVNSMKRGDELPNGVLQMVKVYVASRRQISVGDKMAGVTEQRCDFEDSADRDMPFLEDGTPVDIVLNPLGVPSRMNVGQILETHLGWAASKLGFRCVCPVFDGASKESWKRLSRKRESISDAKVRLYDGRTGEMFEQKSTVGIIYMLKLHHLVDDKCTPVRPARTRSSLSSRWVARPASAVSDSGKWKCGRWKRMAPPTSSRSCSP